MQFEVRVLGASQQVHTLRVDALDAGDARRQAEAQGAMALSATPVRRAFGSARSGFALLLFAEELHALVTVGLSVVEAIETLAEKESSADARAVLLRLHMHLTQGLSLSGALREQPSVFPPLFVGVIQAAEGTSDLPRSLARYVAYERRMAAVRHQVLSAIIYPVILLVVGTAVAMFLLGYVVPRFSAVYASTGRPMPWASELLLTWGNFAGRHTWALVCAFCALVAGTVMAARAQLRHHGWWRLLHAIPGARPRLEALELSRIYLTLGMLLEGGITLPQSLSLSAAVSSGRRAGAIDAARQQIESGESVSDALVATGLGTPVALRLVRVGERTGQLGEMLTRAAAFYEGETTRWLERFAKVFEPALMTAIGLVIGLIVVLLYMPVFDLAGSFQ